MRHVSSFAPTSDTLAVLRALASPKRMQILEWLRDPVANFPPQRDGDLVKDGVCVIFIADKLGVAQPTATTHLQELARTGLVTPKRIGQWTFYKRDERAIRDFQQQLRRRLANEKGKVDAGGRPGPRKSPRSAVSVPREATLEELTCASCRRTFSRTRVRGRKPKLCPACRREVAQRSVSRR